MLILRSVSELAHCICNFLEACDVSALNIVDVSVLLLSFANTCVEDVLHDCLEHIVYLRSLPFQVLCVLAHLETGNCYTTCVSCFSRSEWNLLCLECFDSFWCTTHVGNLDNILYAVLDKLFSILAVKLVLKSCCECDVARNFPDLLSRNKLCTLELLCIRSNDVLV